MVGRRAERGYAVDPAPTAAGRRRDDDRRSVARHGAVMALGSIISRVTGFLRTAAIGAAIGAVAVGNDYNLANTLPGMVYELLLGGVLASVVVPLLVRARTRDADRGEAYAQRLLTLAVRLPGRRDRGRGAAARRCSPPCWPTTGPRRPTSS